VSKVFSYTRPLPLSPIYMMFDDRSLLPFELVDELLPRVSSSRLTQAASPEIPDETLEATSASLVIKNPHSLPS
jgi:hypothetical protein